jgi:hypothetical protein
MIASLVSVPFASAQDSPAMTSAEIAAACAPPAAQSNAAHALRVVGSQDTVPRSVFGRADLLVISGGTGEGVQLGAKFFLRRASASNQLYGMPAGGDLVTDGWIEIVAVNDSTSIARVTGLCGAIYTSDYLEPFAPPTVLAQADEPLTPNFDALGRVLGGSDGRTLTAINQFAIIDQGSEQGLQPGSRFAIYRDLTSGVDPLLAAPQGTPLTSIGEGVVLSATGNRAVVRIVRARDAVRTGDYVAPQKQ